MADPNTIVIPGSVRPWEVDLANGGPPQATKTDRKSAVVQALLASDPNGPGLGGGNQGFGGWSGFEDFANSGTPSIPGARVASVDKFGAAQDRVPPGTVLAFGDDGSSAQRAIETYAPRSAAFSPWGPDWTTGIGAVHQPMLLGSPGHFASGDSWAGDRIGGETYAPRPGMVTGAAPSISPVAAALVAANARPITYSAPVAAGNFAQGSPNQSFEKQNGMGSVTNSMASSSRWNTGY